MLFIQTFSIVPWHGKLLIETFIYRQLIEHGKVVEDELPDMDDIKEKSLLNYEAGYQFHFFSERLDLTPIFDAFLKQIKEPTEENRRFTYEVITSYPLMDLYCFEIGQWLWTMNFNLHCLKLEAIWLLNHAAHREVMKFSLVLLQHTPVNDLVDRLFNIAHHEEFTHLAIQAINNSGSISSEKLWELNDKLKGWGKVHLLEVITVTTKEQKEKLLYMDYPEKYYTEFPALHIAKSVNLLKIARQSFVSRVQYEAIGRILEALFSPFIFDDFSQYKDTVHVLKHYIRHSKSHCQTLYDFYPLARVQQLLETENVKWETLYEEGWTIEVRNELHKMLQPFINDPKWRHLSMDELLSVDTRLLHVFVEYFNYDLTEWAFEQLVDDQYNTALYRIILTKCNLEDLKKVEQFILTNIDLSFPTLNEWKVVSCFFKYLRFHNGAGIDIIKCVFKQQIDQLHAKALVTMLHWNREIILNPPFIELIQNLEEKSNHPNTKRLIRRLFNRDI